MQFCLNYMFNKENISKYTPAIVNRKDRKEQTKRMTKC